MEAEIGQKIYLEELRSELDYIPDYSGGIYTIAKVVPENNKVYIEVKKRKGWSVLWTHVLENQDKWKEEHKDIIGKKIPNKKKRFDDICPKKN